MFPFFNSLNASVELYNDIRSKFKWLTYVIFSLYKVDEKVHTFSETFKVHVDLMIISQLFSS